MKASGIIKFTMLKLLKAKFIFDEQAILVYRNSPFFMIIHNFNFILLLLYSNRYRKYRGIIQIQVMKTQKIGRQLSAVSTKAKCKAKFNENSQSQHSSQSRQYTSPIHEKNFNNKTIIDPRIKINKNICQKASNNCDKETVRQGQNLYMNHEAKNRKLDQNKQSRRDREKAAKSKNKNESLHMQKIISKPANQKAKVVKESEKKNSDSSNKKQKKNKKNQKVTKKAKKADNGEEACNEGKKKLKIGLPDQQKKLAIDLQKKNPQYSNSNKTTIRQNQASNVFKIKQLPSFRQYCVIKGIFVPLQSTTERKCLDNIFFDTACTSPESNQNGFIQKAKDNVNQAQMVKQIAYSQIGIQTIKTELAHYEVLVKAAQQDIGVQYSDRLNSGRKSVQCLLKDNTKIKPPSNIEINENEASSRPGLLQMMMKIQSLELDDNSGLQQLGVEQKRHFRQIFESLIAKMKSPRSEAPLKCPREIESIEQISKLKYETKESGAQIEQKRDELQQLLMMRQSRQTNQFNITVRSPQQIDTSILAIIAGFADIFCYVQMNHEENLLQIMNSLYGLSYTDKYRCVSKYCSENQRNYGKEQVVISTRIKMEILKREAIVKALPDKLFVNFMKEITEAQNDDQDKKSKSKESIAYKLFNKDTKAEELMQSKSYFWIHSKAIFDCINELLIPYRPFYPTKGDPFPWTMSPLKCLTFYSIDSESLDTVIEQIQQKITKFAKSLCGIHIDGVFYKAEDYCTKQETQNWSKDVVFSIRRQRLSRCLIEEELADDPYLQLEIQTTCVLHQLSLLVSDLIMQQFLEEMIQMPGKRKRMSQ